jgi:hypothetical protein
VAATQQPIGFIHRAVFDGLLAHLHWLGGRIGQDSGQFARTAIMAVADSGGQFLGECPNG